MKPKLISTRHEVKAISDARAQAQAQTQAHAVEHFRIMLSTSHLALTLLGLTPFLLLPRQKGEGPVIVSREILRLALDGPHKDKFKSKPSLEAMESQTVPASLGSPRTEWVDKCNLSAILGGDRIPEGCEGAARIKEGLVVDMKAYLTGLWRACELEGAQWRCEPVASLSSLLHPSSPSSSSTPFDAVVVAAGAGIRGFPELSPLWNPSLGEDSNEPGITRSRRRRPLLSFSRGQSLVFRHDGCLTAALLCGEYVVPVGDRIICGATHEHLEQATTQRMGSEDGRGAHEATMESPSARTDETDGGWVPTKDPKQAVEELSTVASRLYPPLARLTPLAVTSGTRVVPMRTHLGKLPLAARLPWMPEAWVLTALGSRGLIHHAVLAKALARAVLHDDQSFLLSLFSTDVNMVQFMEEKQSIHPEGS